jgi:Flp pilus assembly pilin Flp
MPNPDSQRGQGLTEYAVILALVVIAIIGIAVTFGDDLRQMFDNSGSSGPATLNTPKVESPSGATAGTTAKP